MGAETTVQGQPTGAQVSLFDVGDPARPARLARIFRKDSDTCDIADPHAFAYWAPTRTAFVPFRSYSSVDGRSTVLVVRVGTDSLRTLGVIDNPVSGRADYDGGIVRALVIGDSIWTMSAGGLRVSAAADLHQHAWIRFS